MEPILATETEIGDLEPAKDTIITDEAGAANAAETPASAEPSTATDASKPEGALSIVRDVVEARKAPAEASSAEGVEEPGKTGDTATKEPDNENFSDVPFHKHPRFQQVLGEVKTLRPDAERYRNVQTFLDTNGVNAEEAAEILTVAALAKTNPAEAWKRVQPWVQKVLVAAGEVLPDDLKDRVGKGELSTEAALELSRTRAQVESHQAATTFQQQQAERRAQTEASTARLGAAAEWEADRRLKDPNFEAKQGPLMREVAFLIQTEGQPKDAVGIRDQLKRAYDAVNKSFKPAVVTPRTPTGQFQAVRPVNGGQVAAVAPTGPQSTLDIIRANRIRAAG
jgi:hypothetical protein